MRHQLHALHTRVNKTTQYCCMKKYVGQMSGASSYLFERQCLLFIRSYSQAPESYSNRKGIGHVNDYPLMHYFGIPGYTQSIIAYKILNEYFWNFQLKIALWECC